MESPGRSVIALLGGGIPTVVTMRVAKTKLGKSVEALMENAEDCFDLAEAGHAQADKQHAHADKQEEIAATQHAAADGVDANADHLETLARALVEDAVELKVEIETINTASPPASLNSPKVAA